MGKSLKEQIDKKKLPEHIAVIMDGNGRWAEKRAIDRTEGHKAGVKAVRAVVEGCRELGVKYLTLYSFSRENWGRPKREVRTLMKLLEEYLKKEVDELNKHDIRLNVIGRISDLPGYVRSALRNAVKKTRNNKAMVLTLALSYSGRDEIIRGIRKLLREGKKRITEKDFDKYLDTKDIPDPSLIIRTSGEFRVSNFLLWQMAYSELYITKVLWPDFRKRHLYRAIIDYQRRERRFGLTSAQIRRNLKK